MHAGTIIWNSVDLSRLGKPRLTISRSADPPAPAMPTRMLVDLAVTIDLDAMDSGTVDARARELLNLMQSPEGILSQSSGTGNAGSWLAVPGENNIAEALGGKTNRVRLSFAAVEPYGSNANLHSATFQAEGGSTIHLHAIRNWNPETRTNRHSERSAARSHTVTTYSFVARVAQANPSESASTRRTYLQTQADFIRSMNIAEGTLMTHGVNAIVRVTDFSPIIDERAGVLDVTVQCYSLVLPDDDTAECKIDRSEGLDEGTGEEVISIKGEIFADSKDIALAKLGVLRAAELAITGQRVISWRTDTQKIDGADTVSNPSREWPGSLSFSMEVRKTRDGAHKTLKTSIRKDMRSGWKWTYSGTVRAKTAAASLAAARAVMTGLTHPLLVSTQETIDEVSDILDPAKMQFVKVDFTYEFEGPADGFIGGEISTELTSPLAGEWRTSASGYLVANTKAIALAKLATLLSGYGIPLEESDKWSEVIEETTSPASAAKRQFMKLDFSRAYRRVRTRAVAEYTDSTQTSIPAMRQTRSVAGTLWTSDTGNAENALTAFLQSIFTGTAPHETTRGKALVRYGKIDTPNSLSPVDGGGEYFVKLDFSATRTVPLTGVVGYDLLEASLTMERIGAIDNTVITNIPFGRPNAQSGTGWLPGSITITAQAKAINKATARAWVQGQRALVASIGQAGVTRHETQQPRESESPEYVPLNVGDPVTTTFSATYGWTFTGGVLDGLWG